MSYRFHLSLSGLAILSVSCLLAIGALEIFLRITGLQEEFFFQLDPEVGASYIPNKKGWYSYPDGREWLEINSFGYRDKEWRHDKEEGTQRIVLLGDSYVAAMEVPKEQRLGELLEDRLNSECGQNGNAYEVLNFAVMGFGTAQQLETLRFRAGLFSPDHVLQFFYTGNDLYNNYRPIDAEPNRLHYDLDDEGNLFKLSYSVRDHPLKRWLRHHSRLYLFVRDRVKRISALHRAGMAAGLMQRTEVAAGGTAVSGGLATTRQLRETQYFANPPVEIEQAWRVTSALLQETRKLAEQIGASYHLVTIPTRFEIEYSRRRPSESRSEGALDMLAPSRKIGEICREHGFSCLDLAYGFTAATMSPTEWFFPKAGHWTRLGHRVAADTLVPWLVERICKPSDHVPSTREIGPHSEIPDSASCREQHFPS